MELPAADCFAEPLAGAARRGEVQMETIDLAVRRVLAQKLALGLFENPFVDENGAAVAFDTPAQRALARRAAAWSLVLLSNDGILPLGATITGTIALIGPGADDQRLLQGDYHYPAHQEIIGADDGPRVDVDDEVVGGPIPDPGRDGQSLLQAAGPPPKNGWHYTAHVTPLAGLRRGAAQAAPRARSGTERGCDVDGTDQLRPAGRGGGRARRRRGRRRHRPGRSGLRAGSTVGEGRDVTSLRLTGVQEELVTEVAATGTPTIVVVLSGRVHTLETVTAAARAVIQAWPPGEEGGHALAGILLGRAEPSGRLPVTLPRAVGQIPVYASPRAGGTKAMFRGSYTDAPATPLFPFGHGLTYTTFAYGPLAVQAGGTGDDVLAAVDVHNLVTGRDRSGPALRQRPVRIGGRGQGSRWRATPAAGSSRAGSAGSPSAFASQRAGLL